MVLYWILLLLLVYVQRGRVTSPGNPVLPLLSLDWGFQRVLVLPLPESRPERVLRMVPESHHCPTAPFALPSPESCLLRASNVSSEMLWASDHQLRLSQNHMNVIPYGL